MGENKEKACAPAVVRAGAGRVLNVRAKAAANAKVVKTVPDGEEVAAAPVSRNWMEIEGVGFAVAEYLEVVSAEVEEPETEDVEG